MVIWGHVTLLAENSFIDIYKFTELPSVNFLLQNQIEHVDTGELDLSRTEN